jgi:hypothetical protein
VSITARLRVNCLYLDTHLNHLPALKGRVGSLLLPFTEKAAVIDGFLSCLMQFHLILSQTLVNALRIESE